MTDAVNSQCIYCDSKQTEPFADEHVIPRLAGKFLLDHREIVLNRQTCNSCNGFFSGLEQEIAYSGFESVWRNKTGVKGRKRKKPKSSPYYQSGRVPYPVIMLGQRPDDNHAVRLEVDPKTGKAKDLCQIEFEHPESGEWHSIPLTESTTKQDVVEQIQKFGGSLDGDFVITCDDEDRVWLDSLLLALNPVKKVQWTHRSDIETSRNETISVTVETQITEKHQRAIAKIALNYLCYFRPAELTGYEPVFDPVKKFIRFGNQDPRQFIRIVNHDPISSSHRFSPKHYGHVLTLEIDQYIKASVNLFTGRDMEHGYYQILFGKNPYRVKFKTAIGHFFRILSDHKSDSDIGDVIELRPISLIRPVVQKTNKIIPCQRRIIS